MKNTELKEIIINQVKNKASQLSKWKKVRWEGGRLYYETHTILNEISSYNLELQIFYLETLFNEDFIIQDNWPSEAPDITKEFKDWLLQTISQLKVEQLQKNSFNQKKTTITNKNLFKSILSNPWTIAIVSGLVIAFLAKKFGWL